jgi:hypothetical protein
LLRPVDALCLLPVDAPRGAALLPAVAELLPADDDFFTDLAALPFLPLDVDLLVPLVLVTAEPPLLLPLPDEAFFIPELLPPPDEAVFALVPFRLPAAFPADAFLLVELLPLAALLLPTAIDPPFAAEDEPVGTSPITAFTAEPVAPTTAPAAAPATMSPTTSFALP